MRNILLVARREYLEQIRGRAFRISTLLVPVLIVFLLGVSGYTGRKLAASRHIAIAADNANLAGDIRDNLLSEKSDHYTIETVAPFTPQDLADLRAKLAADEKPRVVVLVPSAAVPAGTRGNVIRLGDPADSEYIVVRLGRGDRYRAQEALAPGTRGFRRRGRDRRVRGGSHRRRGRRRGRHLARIAGPSRA